MTRDLAMVNPIVSPSLHLSLCQNECIHHQTFSTTIVGVTEFLNSSIQCRKDTYFGNDTRQTHSYYGSLTGRHRWPIKPCHFRWP